jgi:hypothetical protein
MTPPPPQGDQPAETESQDLLRRIEELERRVSAEVGTKRLQSERAAADLVQRVADLSEVNPKDVQRVLDALGLRSLQRNLEAAESPVRVVEDGRLVVSLLSNRQMISA